MKSRKNPLFNKSGLADPTAYHALKPMIKEDASVEKQSSEIIKIIKSIISLTGFELISRIQIRHKKSGKEFK
ncbi:hypothetical protein ACFO0S_09735 [Chryseomicrobium palamuruense]|uniref:Uncharacterized protein n=1 Tax=Chryseomicrobium palamuruense TaxID=682973 RepID=A0ABV8UVH7_9BACL